MQLSQMKSWCLSQMIVDDLLAFRPRICGAHWSDYCSLSGYEEASQPGAGTAHSFSSR